jgi:hypothetical protein
MFKLKPLPVYDPAVNKGRFSIRPIKHYNVLNRHAVVHNRHPAQRPGSAIETYPQLAYHAGRIARVVAAVSIG